MDRIQKEKDIAFIASALAYLCMVAVFYAIFTAIGIKSTEAALESVVITSTAITPFVLYLFGRAWKMEP